MTATDPTLTWHYVEKWAMKRPNAEALVFGEERLTWTQFKEQMDRTAKAFLEIGVKKGDCVAFLGMARNEFLTTFMAANKVGAIWLGLSPKFSLDELRYILSDAQPAVLVTLREYQGKDLLAIGEPIVHELPCLKKVLAIGQPIKDVPSLADYVNRGRPGLEEQRLDQALAARVVRLLPDDDALLMYTSGSTGKPKGVVHTHRSILASVAVQTAKFEFHESMRSLLHFPINHVAADVEIGFATVFAGGTTVSMERFDPVASLQTIEQERITLVGQVPAMFLLQMSVPEFKKADLSSVKAFVWSGAAAPRTVVETLSRIAAETGAHLYNGYGSTELAGFVTYTEPGDDLNTLCDTAGKTADPFELHIVDENRNEVARGVIGEIAVRGPLLMKEYYKNPEATAAKLDADGWFYTDDLAWKDDRDYIHITGRKSEMFKTGGENVFPREIEDVLEAHPDVLLAAVVGVPDPIYGETGCAFVTLRTHHSLTAEELREHCRQYLANFKVPKRFEIRTELPLLPNGKVNKVALKQTVAAEKG